MSAEDPASASTDALNTRPKSERHATQPSSGIHICPGCIANDPLPACVRMPCTNTFVRGIYTPVMRQLSGPALGYAAAC